MWVVVVGMHIYGAGTKTCRAMLVRWVRV